jgi:protein tyrosine/serine phosphatase
MPGGVAFHCGGGRDRAGQITMVLLALLGVAPSDIAAEYMLSYERLPARYAARGEPDQGPLLQPSSPTVGPRQATSSSTRSSHSTSRYKSEPAASPTRTS